MTAELLARVYLIGMPIAFVLVILTYEESVKTDPQNSLDPVRKKQFLSIATGFWPFVLIAVIGIGLFYIVKNSILSGS